MRTTKYPREIPPLPWYRRAFPQMLMAGFLPFSAIYIELYYIFASVWGHKVRTSRHTHSLNPESECSRLLDHVGISHRQSSTPTPR